MSRHFGGLTPVRRNDKSRYVIILSAFLLVVCGFVAIVFLASGPSTANQPTAVVIHEPQIEMADVLVPVQKIDQGTALEQSMFRKEKRPRVGLSANVVKDFEQVQGYYAAALIVSDQPLNQEYITKVRPINQITERIPIGYRAVTIRVDNKTAVEGWVVPGARVDVVWATSIQGKQAIQVIVENALVLSADKSGEVNPQKQVAAAPSTITLQVTTEDAKKVQLASISGSLSLSLRGDKDVGDSAPSSPLTVDDLLGRTNGERAAPVQNCKGKVKTCTKDGMCEELCLGDDGKLSPMIAR
jgi:pilus assembly protein CpaB